MAANNGNRFLQQMEAYKSFVKSFGESMKAGENISKSLQESTAVYQKIIGENFKKNMRDDYRNLGDNLRQYQNFLRRYNLETQRDIDNLMSRMEGIYDNQEQTERMRNNFRDAMADMEESASRTSDSIQDRLTNITQMAQMLQLNSIASSLDSGSNTLLESTRRLQVVGVGTSEEVGNYRDSVSSVVDQLNEETGNKYNLKDMYNDIATLAENTDIARLDTLKEIAKPTMLAYKSMNVSLDSIADYTSKMYEYAGIDSLKMEGMLDYVKGISVGMNVNEQSVIDNQRALQDIVLAYANNKNMDANQIETIMNEIADATVVLENSGIDSAVITNQLKDFFMNPYESDLGKRYSVVTGSSMSNEELLNSLLAEGGINAFIDEYTKGLANITEDAMNMGSFNYAETATLMDSETLLDIYNAHTGKYDQSRNKLDELKEAGTEGAMTESVEDQYISVIDSISNKFSTALSILTDIKESLGFGFGDVITAIGYYSIGKSLLGGGGSGGGLFRGLGGGAGGAGTAGGAGILGALKGVGSNALLNVGVLGQNVLTAGGISTTSMSLGSLAAAGGATIGGGLLGGAGILSGLKDAYSAITGKENGQELSSKERQDEGFSAGSKLGMVGAGAGIGTLILPGLGTAIGAGVGGLSAIFTGDKVGGFLSDTWDSAEEGASKLWSNMETWGIDTWGSIEKSASESLASMRDFGESIWEDIGSFASDIWDDAMGKILNTKDLIEEKGLLSGLATSFMENTRTGNALSSIGDHLKGSLGIPSYSVGTNYVKSDQLAYVHEGEAIVPKKYNPAANTTELETLRGQSKQNLRIQEDNDDKILQALESLSAKVGALLELFEEYSESADKRDKEEKLMSTINTNRTLMYTRLGKTLPSLLGFD